MHALVKGHSASLSLEKQHRENPGAAFALFVNGSGGLFSRQDAASVDALETAEDALDRLVVVDAEDGDGAKGEHVRGKLAGELDREVAVLFPDNVSDANRFLGVEVAEGGAVRIGFEVVGIPRTIGGAEDISEFDDEAIEILDLDGAFDGDGIGGRDDRGNLNFDSVDRGSVFVEDDAGVSRIPEGVEGPAIAVVDQGGVVFRNHGGVSAPVEGEAGGVGGLEDFHEVEGVKRVAADGAEAEVELADLEVFLINVHRVVGGVLDDIQADREAKGISRGRQS